MSDPRGTAIKVMGLGGGGANAVNRMIELGIEGIEFIAANTDAQTLAQSLAPTRLQLGPSLTRGLGAGGKPEIGEAAADESRAEIKAALEGADMIFLAAGLGGGTGTGAIPIAAEVARSVGALTIAVVTTPFTFEGSRRSQNAQTGLAKLRPHVDTLLTVPNDKLLPLVGRNATLELSLRVADEVLRQGVQGIAELVNRPGLINVDFAHIRALMKQAGGSMLAIGQGKGDNKAAEAVRQALKMPLLDIGAVNTAGGILVHFTGGEDLSLHEVSYAAADIGRAAPQAEIIFGATIDPLMNGRAQVIVVATGLGQAVSKVEGSQPAPPVAVAAPASAPRSVVRPALSAAEEPAGGEGEQAYLAEALFSRAAAAGPLERPWIVTDAAPAKAHDLDEPAFLRRRRSLRDFQGAK
jgi:cell division protein FtsZ